MKKRYSKPEVMFENFALSTNIASNCDVIISGHSANTCGLEYEGEYLFIASVDACKDPVSVDDGSCGFCYDVPFETNDLFNS